MRILRALLRFTKLRRFRRFVKFVAATALAAVIVFGFAKPYLSSYFAAAQSADQDSTFNTNGQRPAVEGPGEALMSSATANPSTDPVGTQAIEPSETADLQPMPQISGNQAPVETTCQDYLGSAWPDRISPGVSAYMLFPTRQPLNLLMAKLQPYTTAKFYNETVASWKATDTPLYWSQAVTVTNCVLGRREGVARALTVSLHLTSVDASNSPSYDILTYDVYVVRSNGQYFIAAILPAGSTADLGGDGA